MCRRESRQRRVGVGRSSSSLSNDTLLPSCELAVLALGRELGLGNATLEHLAEVHVDLLPRFGLVVVQVVDPVLDDAQLVQLEGAGTFGADEDDPRVRDANRGFEHVLGRLDGQGLVETSATGAS